MIKKKTEKIDNKIALNEPVLYNSDEKKLVVIDAIVFVNRIKSIKTKSSLLIIIINHLKTYANKS